MTKKPHIEKKVCDAALKLAASKSWSSLSLEAIAKTAKLPLSEIKKYFTDRNAILPAIVRQIDEDVAKEIDRPKARATPHDRLFEVMMARFDQLQSHRKAILNIMTEVRQNPSLARTLLPAQFEAMQTMLSLAGLKQDGPHHIVSTIGLTMIYGLTLCSWQKDESKDMAKTMSMLDRSLRRAGRLAEILFRVP